MKPHKWTIIVTAPLALISFIICIALHYSRHCEEAEFWVNVCLAVFGSSLLTLFTAISNYYDERKRTFVRFETEIIQMLRFIERYDRNWGLEDKVKFLISYIELNKNLFWYEYDNMDFFSRTLQNDICQNICCPMEDFNKFLHGNEKRFRIFLDESTCKNPEIKRIMYELERKLFNIKKDVRDNSNSSHTLMESTSSKFVLEMSKQINRLRKKVFFRKSEANAND